MPAESVERVMDLAGDAEGDGLTDRARRVPHREGRAERGRLRVGRADRRARDPGGRVRLGAGRRPPARDRRVRPRRGAGRRVADGQPDRRPRLRRADRHDDRHRRRHRLRPVHRHPLPQRVDRGARAPPGGRARRSDGRAGGGVRRVDGGDLDLRPRADGPQLPLGRRSRHLAGGDRRGVRLDHPAPGPVGLRRAQHRPPADAVVPPRRRGSAHAVVAVEPGDAAPPAGGRAGRSGRAARADGAGHRPALRHARCRQRHRAT